MFIRKLEKYDQWKDKYQIFLMTLQQIIDKVQQSAFDIIKQTPAHEIARPEALNEQVACQSQ